MRLAVGTAKEHEAAATDVAGVGINHLQRESDGDSGIDRIAALLHNLYPNLRRLAMYACHHRLGRVRRLDHVAGVGIDYDNV